MHSSSQNTTCLFQISSLCRLLYAIIACLFKILFLPCRLICCRGSMQRSGTYAYDIDSAQPDVGQNIEEFDEEFNPDFSRADGAVPVMT